MQSDEAGALAALAAVREATQSQIKQHRGRVAQHGGRQRPGGVRQDAVARRVGLLDPDAALIWLCVASRTRAGPASARPPSDCISLE